MSSFFPKTYVYDFFMEKGPAHSGHDSADAQTPGDFEHISVVTPQRRLVMYALKHIELIMAKPFLKKIAHKMKSKYYVRNAPYIESAFNAERYMYLNSVDFIQMMYQKLLGREADEAGLDEKIRFFQRGGSKGAIVYSIFKSTEFNNRFRIMHIDRYKKEYKKYRLIMLLRRTPILSAYVRAKALDRALGDMRALIISSNASTMHSIGALRDNTVQNISTLRDSTTHEINALRDGTAHEINALRDGTTHEVNALRDGTAHELNTLRDSSQQRLTELESGIAQEIIALRDSTMLDINKVRSRTDNLYGTFAPYMDVISTKVPQSLITKGVFDVASYIEKATENLTEEEKKHISSCSFEDKYYFLLAKLYRGSEQELHKIFDNYLDAVVKAINNTGCNMVIDLGCGKGDWLRYLSKHGIHAKGVDINEASAHFAIHDGFDIEIDDIEDYLSRLQDCSVGVITLISVSEHLTHEKLKAVIAGVSRVLTAGGVFIMDAPNPYCYFHVGGFYLDPSHITWVSPEPIKLLLEMVGFYNVCFVYFAPYEWLNKSPSNLYNYQGVGIIAEKGSLQQ